MKERHHKIDRQQFEEAAANFNGQRCHELNRVDVALARAASAEKDLARARRLIGSLRASKTALYLSLVAEKEAHAVMRWMASGMARRLEMIHKGRRG